ncbi:MAG TPA: DegV family protein [Anaerolineales bacterium]|nr:DegV family protein [Anaerolineales bacterium]
MSIKIVTDSTCDLPQGIIDQYQIKVVPLYINIGDEGYLDQVEISRKTFYENLPDYPVQPTTGTPGIQAFQEAYQSLADEGATHILSIHISESLSATVDVARMAAEQFTAVPVTVLDSQQLSMGTGFAVLTAAQLIEAGEPLERVLEAVQDQMARTHVFAALDTLEFLRRSGRLNGVVSGIGSLLQLKPILTMNKGVADSVRVRTSKKAFRKVIGMLKENMPIEKVALLHTNAVESAHKLVEMAAGLLPEGEVDLMDITPVIGAHIGPGAAGFAIVTAKE